MVKKTVKIFFLLIVMTYGFQGCTSKDPDRHYNKGGFSIKFPKGWETKEGFMGTSVISLSPQKDQNDQFRENVNVVVEPLLSPMGVDDYFNANLANLGKFMTDYNEIEKGNSSISNTDAKRLIYSANVGNMKLQFLVYMTVHGKNGFVVTCSSTPEEFAAYKNQFEEIVKTFEFD